MLVVWDENSIPLDYFVPKNAQVWYLFVVYVYDVEPWVVQTKIVNGDQDIEIFDGQNWSFKS